MKKLISSLCIFAFIFTQSLTQETASFEHNVTSRGMGMGGAFTAVANDASAVIWNAAGMFQESSVGAGASYTWYLNLVSAGSAYGKYVYDEDLAFGAYIKTDGDDLYSEMEINLAAAYDLYSLTYIDQLYAGLNFHYRHNSWGDENTGVNPVKGSGSGFGLDFSLFYKINKNVNLGLKYNNFIDSFKWNNSSVKGYSSSESESAPSDLRFGIAYQNGMYKNVSIEYRFGFDEYSLDRIFLGAEHSIKDVVMFRAGYSRNLMSKFDNTNEIYHVGLSVKVQAISLNYTYEITDIQNTFWVGFDINM